MTSKLPPESTRVLKRRFQITSSFQESPDCYRVKILLYWDEFEKRRVTKTREIDVKLTADQFTNYRKFQKAILKQSGAIIYSQKVEAAGVGRWPCFLAEYLGEVAK